MLQNLLIARNVNVLYKSISAPGMADTANQGVAVGLAGAAGYFLYKRLLFSLDISLFSFVFICTSSLKLPVQTAELAIVEELIILYTNWQGCSHVHVAVLPGRLYIMSIKQQATSMDQQNLL